MNWTLDQLQSFVYSAQLGSFSAAARKLGKAQSRVSTAVANLEADLGFELFDRSRKLPELTPLGKEMLVEAKGVLEQAQRLQSRALSASKKEEIELVLAVDEAIQVMAFAPIFVELGEAFPNLKLTIINGSREDISLYIEQGKADLGVLFKSRQIDEELEFTSIGQYRLRLIAGQDHPLTRVKAPTIVDLQQYRQFVICDRNGEGRDEPLVAHHWYIDSYFVIGDLVGNGMGWALIPDHIASAQWYRDSLVQLPADNLPVSLTAEVGLIRRRENGIGVVSEWLHHALKNIFIQPSSI
ncbi:LysR family transcriptional regulator [Vibrio breoganii]|uniref:LysR family transcriptional regulator n=1 Tax=Vibrio breoganii TaxID=553239 RepID=A0AAP8SY94_9VIBR|nr:LysR family transcriptional regulator [Vibrio breoganii]OCH74495.1 LysR family transcriptional regulator [Vibrio breoganii]OEF87477.1 LysR family transcriptional regulator [Vibrio breoganii 1C10]PMF98842.1 LysR family transcriptional regulator [Vibrio breoganii]PMG04542.1 LysR family transcriptional regulator [Vibrio breoganii]PMG89220.1 LysR family transcriptional regulator [Vibrio breoganii]